MPLILGTTPNNNWQVICGLCDQAGWQTVTKHPETWFKAENAQIASDDRVLLLHSHPVEAIAHAIAEGKSPTSALDEWLTAAKAMIHFYKRHRNQAVMAYVPHVLASPKVQLESIATHLGLDASSLPATAPQTSSAPLLEQLMASHVLRLKPDINLLLAQVEACTLPLEDYSYQAPELDINAANEQFIALRGDLNSRDQQIDQLQRELSDQAAEKNKAEDEGQLLLEQLHLVQEELEAKLLSHKELEEKLAGTEAQLQLKQTELGAQLAELKPQIQQSQEENTLLLEQLHLVQEELESQFIARQNLETELTGYREQQDYALEAANHQIKRLQTELNNFKSSAAWKATAPVRALKRPFRRNIAKKAVKKQADLVRQSGMFNEGWYLKSYPDVSENGADPIEHYLKFGAEERRNPSPEFDTQWYLTNYPDVAEEGINPLVHYIKFGQNEGRAMSAYHHPSLPAPDAV